MADPVKQFYQKYHDRISDKRWNSPYHLRRYVHRSNYAGILDHVRHLTPCGGKVLDAGCGDGLLTFLIADALMGRNVTVIGVDISEPNIRVAKERLDRSAPLRNLHYHLGDAERLPYHDRSFDLVISSHVLEHLSDFDRGLSEIYRLTKKYALVALPTCLNPCAMVQLGGNVFWAISKRSLLAFGIGFIRVLASLGREGVDEGYAGHRNLRHIWRYPWVVRSRLQRAGFQVEHFEAQTLCIPYLGSAFPRLFIRIQQVVDKMRALPIFNNFGYGSLAVLSKSEESERTTFL